MANKNYIAKNVLFSALAIVSFFLFADLILRIAGFEYVPLNDDFVVSPENRIFDREGNLFKTKLQKAGSFYQQTNPIDKIENSYRIFLVGGSSINHLESADYLGLELAGRFPSKNFEIINCGGMAYGTTRLRIHFQEILEYDPNLIILYTGHNEFNEKYLRNSFYQENLISKLNDSFFKVSKLYQFISFLIHRFMVFNITKISQNEHPLFSDIVFLQSDEEYDKKEVYSNYRTNIIEMILLARKYGVDIMMGTVAYNRIDPPYLAGKNTREECQTLYEEGKYSWALKCYEQALDEDLQPHRATEASNAIIHEIAEKYKVPLVDIDSLILANAEHGIPGFDLFDDRCHLNAEGNIMLQQAFYEGIERYHFIE